MSSSSSAFSVKGPKPETPDLRAARAALAPGGSPTACMCAAVALKTFCLTQRVLDKYKLQCELEENPHHKSFAPMRKYLVSDLKCVARKVHGTPEQLAYRVAKKAGGSSALRARFG